MDNGDVLRADAGMHRVLRVSPSGEWTPLAGSGDAGFSGDGETALGAMLNRPSDVLPDNATLYGSDSSVYQVLVRHQGCRSNSAQNDSYQVAGCGLDCIFQFAVGGKFGAFPADAPRTAGLCVNSYLMWNHRVSRSATGLDWTDALPVIAAYPYGPAWHEQCAGGGDSP